MSKISRLPFDTGETWRVAELLKSEQFREVFARIIDNLSFYGIPLYI